MDATSKGKDDANYVTRDSSMLHVTKVNLIKLLLFFFVYEIYECSLVFLEL